MTEQEIAKLVFNAGSLGEFPKLQRLLEERRRLVAALREAAEFDPITNEDFGRLTTIRDALAFAEDPA